ncbi:MAG: ribonuclease III [bacterium]|nr:ribonuclease III [bacterium]
MEKYKKLEKITGIKFKDTDLIKKAFIHKSYVNEHRNEGLKHNERLEFLGDAVLELVATHHLFFKYPDQPEGDMTAFRSALVKGKHLAEVARELELGNYLFLSNGEEKSGGREKNYILANVTEAFIGAIYIEHGYEVCEKFIEKFIMAKLDEIIKKGLHIDAKSQFQEICQEKMEQTPHYDVIEEAGPDHDKKFTMGAYIGDELIAKGEDSSKQKAEEKAARGALKAKGWE